MIDVQTGQAQTEGERIAAELHDGAMQELTLARLQLDLLGAGASDDPHVVEQLGELSDLLADASLRLQDLMRALAPGPRLV